MKLLLDSHIVIALVEQRIGAVMPPFARALDAGGLEGFVSSASLWELEIKSRIGKLALRLPIRLWEPALAQLGFGLLPILPAHIFSAIGMEPATRDPFDRLLLSTCAAEGLKLVTVDRALVDHALAWKPFPR
jgi:PIN domain nuclease of toxin-antitoxin system